MSFERKSLESGRSARLTAQHRACHSPKGRHHLQDLQDQGSETQGVGSGGVFPHRMGCCASAHNRSSSLPCLSRH